MISMYDLPVEAVSKIRTGGGHLNFFAATVMQTVLESGILQMITVFIGINHFDKSDVGQAVDKTDVKQAVLIGGTWGAAVSAAAKSVSATAAHLRAVEVEQ